MKKYNKERERERKKKNINIFNTKELLVGEYMNTEIKETLQGQNL